MLDTQIVVNWFEQEGVLEPEKLNYLLYFTQATYLAGMNKKLFDAQFVAGENGPRVENIDQLADNQAYRKTAVLDENINEFLYEIMCVYGMLSSDRMSEMTCQEIPWIQARMLEDEMPYISDDLLKDYYSRMEAIQRFFDK